MKLKPNNFHVKYSWREGSIPPPYHYEYLIHLGPKSEGTITFYPDYPMDNPPVWTETFSVNDKTLNELYSLILEKGIFQRSWTEIEDPPVGSSLEWLEVIAHRYHITVPSTIKESQIVDDLYSTIRSIVPAQIWAKLMHQFSQYQSEYLSNTGHS